MYLAASIHSNEAKVQSASIKCILKQYIHLKLNVLLQYIEHLILIHYLSFSSKKLKYIHFSAFKLMY
jgi:hypothetical protein